MSGAELRGAPELFVGAVVNPGADDLDREIGRMEEKIEAGAAFFQTQAVYEPGEFEGFMRRVEGYGVPILAGCIMLKSGRMARNFNANVPGITVPRRDNQPHGCCREPAARERGDYGGDHRRHTTDVPWGAHHGNRLGIALIPSVIENSHR